MSFRTTRAAALVLCAALALGAGSAHATGGIVIGGDTNKPTATANGGNPTANATGTGYGGNANATGGRANSAADAAASATGIGYGGAGGKGVGYGGNATGGNAVLDNTVNNALNNRNTATGGAGGNATGGTARVGDITTSNDLSLFTGGNDQRTTVNTGDVRTGNQNQTVNTGPTSVTTGDNRQTVNTGPVTTAVGVEVAGARNTFNDGDTAVSTNVIGGSTSLNGGDTNVAVDGGDDSNTNTNENSNDSSANAEGGEGGDVTITDNSTLTYEDRLQAPNVSMSLALPSCSNGGGISGSVPGFGGGISIGVTDEMCLLINAAATVCHAAASQPGDMQKNHQCTSLTFRINQELAVNENRADIARMLNELGVNPAVITSIERLNLAADAAMVTGSPLNAAVIRISAQRVADDAILAVVNQITANPSAPAPRVTARTGTGAPDCRTGLFGSRAEVVNGEWRYGSPNCP